MAWITCFGILDTVGEVSLLVLHCAIEWPHLNIQEPVLLAGSAYHSIFIVALLFAPIAIH